MAGGHGGQRRDHAGEVGGVDIRIELAAIASADTSDQIGGVGAVGIRIELAAGPGRDLDHSGVGVLQPGRHRCGGDFRPARGQLQGRHAHRGMLVGQGPLQIVPARRPGPVQGPQGRLPHLGVGVVQMDAGRVLIAPMPGHGRGPPAPDRIRAARGVHPVSGPPPDAAAAHGGLELVSGIPAEP